MYDEVHKISINYDEKHNKFGIEINNIAFSLSPQQYHEFIGASITAMNTVIASKFSESLQQFLENSNSESFKVPKNKKTFTKKDCSLIAEEVDKLFKDRMNNG